MPVPRRRPDRVHEERHSLGDFERQQLSDLKWFIAAPGIGMATAGLAIGAGLYFGAMFFNNSLDEVREWMSTWWMRNIGADDETKAAVMEAVGEVTMEGDTYTYDLPEWAEGMTVYASYSIAKGWEATIFEAQYNRWLAAQGLQHSFEHRKYWRENNRSDFSTRLSNDIFVDPETGETVGISPFAYQLMIRETAARRRQGKVTSVLFGGATGALVPGAGILSAGAAALTWFVGDFIAGDEWTGNYADSAPGFIDDPLLWAAWLRVDFPGTDAIPTVTDPGEVNRGLDYETNLDRLYRSQASDPDDLRVMWPAVPLVPYLIQPPQPGDADFIGPYEYRVSLRDWWEQRDS